MMWCGGTRLGRAAVSRSRRPSGWCFALEQAVDEAALRSSSRSHYRSAVDDGTRNILRQRLRLGK